MVSPRRGSAAAHGTNGVESASKGTARHRSTDRATAIEAEVADAGAAAAPAAGTGKGGAPAGDSSPQRILKKYPNRRLYDTRHSTYITLADVKQMVLEGQDFVVRDAKTSDDLTRSILLQIILEEETGGVPLFSSQMLAQLIRFYGHSMQGMMGSYLEKNLQTLADVQGRFAEQFNGLVGGTALTPELWKQFATAQPPAMSGLMGSYLDQSKNLFAQVQEQMAKQAETLFPGMAPFPPAKR